MATEFRLIHTSYKSLAADARTLADEYQRKEINEETMQNVLTAWDSNCPNLLYEAADKTAISQGLIRIIGKRRAVLLATALKTYSLDK